MHDIDSREALCDAGASACGPRAGSPGKAADPQKCLGPRQSFATGESRLRYCGLKALGRRVGAESKGPEKDSSDMSRLRLVGAVILGCLSLSTFARGGDIAGSSILGRKVENFTLNDFYGKSHALADFKDKKVIVVAFLGTECPVARQYAPRLAELSKKYADKGVQFLGIDANRQDAITEIASYARVFHVDFPILKDLNNKVADQIGAARTPEIFVLDQDRVVRYHGRVDNQYGVGYAKKNASELYLQTALSDLLAGKPVSQAETGVVGCFIGRMRAADKPSKVTYSKQGAGHPNKR